MSTQKIDAANTQHIEVKAAHEEHTRREAHRGTESPVALSQEASNSLSTSARRVSAGQWLREVTGFEAPFGHDGLPTVWG
jgi:hypothetical protein